MVLPHPAGELPVDHGVGPLKLAVGLLEVDVVGVGGQPVADGEGHHLAVHPDKPALQAQSLIVLHGGAQGDALIAQIPLLHLPLPLEGAAVPLLIHLQTLGQASRGDLLVNPGGVVLLKAVDVVALGVELLAPQVGQAVDVVQIVVPVPVGGTGEPAGEELLQLGHLGRGQANQAQGLPPLRRVGLQGTDGGGDVAGAGGVHIAAPRPPIQVGHQEILHPGNPEAIGPLPDIEVGKVIVAAPVVAQGQQFVHPGLIRQSGGVKVDHAVVVSFIV